jgi:hypothetical protein
MSDSSKSHIVVYIQIFQLNPREPSKVPVFLKAQREHLMPLHASPPQKMNKWILSVAHMICQNKYNVGFTQCPKTIPNSTIKGWLSTIPSHRWFVALAFPDYSRYPFFI